MTCESLKRRSEKLFPLFPFSNFFYFFYFFILSIAKVSKNKYGRFGGERENSNANGRRRVEKKMA
jgi:hypothetical protein